MRWRKNATVLLGCVVASALLGGATPDSGTKRLGGDSAKAPAGNGSKDSLGSLSVLREGTQIEGTAGVIRQVASGFIFTETDNGRELLLLENLALERLARLVERSNRAILCYATGTVTEYRGVNYLLLERTVLDAKGNRKSEDGSEPSEGKGT